MHIRRILNHEARVDVSKGEQALDEQQRNQPSINMDPSGSRMRKYTRVVQNKNNEGNKPKITEKCNASIQIRRVK